MLMVVMAPREKWTDERLDDLNKKVDDGFACVQADIRELRREMMAGFVAIIVAIIGSNAAFFSLLT
jgi:hypothetical protein